MTWFKVDDGFWSHPKCLATPAPSVALWVRAGAWSAQHLTDGHVPCSVLPMLGAKAKDAQALVRSGLWHTDGDGWRFHDWDNYQPTSEDIKAQRDATRRRVADWRKKKAEEDAGNAVTNDVRNGVSNAPPVPSRPVPDQTPLLTLVCRRLSRGTRDETTDEEVSVWRDLAGGADLEQELMAWLLYNADVDLRNAGASLRGWLKKAAERSANVAAGAACGQCLDGWLGENAKGQPIPCPTCRPSTRLRVVGE